MPEDKPPSADTIAHEGTINAGIGTTMMLPDHASAGTAGELPGRYQLGPALGEGGMGEVLLAKDQQIGRDVAIKRMRVSSPGLEARFLREARIQGRLEHPAIVPVHELATDSSGAPFFVMKRITGTTLADVLTNDASTFSRQKLLRAFADVCLAVEFAHSRGIVHRDLKPANIMFGDFGEVYILDWGIARILAEADDDIAAVVHGDATEVGAVIGTLGYMSPEQLRAQPLDGRSDVFALGCILFEILGGAPLLPRTRESLEDAFSEIVKRASSRARLRDMDPELVGLCIAATQLEVERRLSSARELAEGIERYLDGDRDLAQRKALAATHLAAARSALASGDGEAERVTAMREAGRSIALDPTSPDAAELVGRLMLEPPRTVPAEVGDRLARIADVTTRRRSMLVAAFAVGFLGFLPLFFWMGITDARAMVGFVVAVACNGLFGLMVARRRKLASAFELHVGAVLSTIVIAVVAWMFTPFLVAPGIAAASVMMFLSDPRIKPKIVVPLTITAVLGPWLLELAGVISPTVGVLHGDLLLDPPAVSVALPATTVALAIYATLLIALSALVAQRLGATIREALRTLELQAWHLRQLVH